MSDDELRIPRPPMSGRDIGLVSFCVVSVVMLAVVVVALLSGCVDHRGVAGDPGNVVLRERGADVRGRTVTVENTRRHGVVARFSCKPMQNEVHVVRVPRGDQFSPGRTTVYAEVSPTLHPKAKACELYGWSVWSDTR